MNQDKEIKAWKHFKFAMNLWLYDPAVSVRTLTIFLIVGILVGRNHFIAAFVFIILGAIIELLRPDSNAK